MNAKILSSKKVKLPAGSRIAKPSKYRNRKCEYDSRTFDSQKERDRYIVLKDRKEKKEIANLLCQHKVDARIDGKHVFYWIADFVYFDHTLHRWIYEDVKGFRTPTYKLKKKVLAALGVNITEV